MICADCGDFSQAEQLLKNGIELFKNIGTGPYEGRDTINEILRLDIINKLNYSSKRDFVSLKYAKAACELKKDYFGLNSDIYLDALLDISRLYAERLKIRKSTLYHNMGYNTYVERIKQVFCSISESERNQYWDKAIKYIDKTIDTAHKAGNKSWRGGEQSLASAAYNALLLSKGLLLNTTIGFDQYVNNSGDREAIRNLQLKKVLSDQQVQQSVLDSLDYVILDNLKQAGLKFELPHLSISWKDVAEKLSDHDIAIEFYKTNKGAYGAVLLKRSWSSPRVVKLKNFISTNKGYLTLGEAANKISLENYTKEQAKDLWKLSKSIWTDDIVKHFPQNGEGNIYFSGEGELLITGIEYLPFVKPDKDGLFYCLSDLFNVQRLSSTRQLVIDKELPSSVEGSVYGGLVYDMSTNDMLTNARQYHTTANFDIAYLPQQRTIREADRAIPYLKGTKNEVDSIMATVNQQGNQTLIINPYIGVEGTETSFKSLSGKNQRLIHLATHGFFYNETDTTFSRFNLGNNPLVRSGLFLSGADNKWFGDSIPESIDDGFLTSLEISKLDLRGLDLVVLSACETGKGNIKGDGVFGLQRGFKMASANSILMSLWKVDDDATCLLMSEFYKNWIGKGKTKHDALELAKQTVRSHKEKGWDKPEFWAAFILLDALD